MRILITNDDGINSFGIKALINELCQKHDLTIIAPDRERSATGHSLTLHKPLRIQPVDLGLPNTKAWQTTGTPTDCVKLALCSMLVEEMPEIVITGINHGPNLGADILYSGTVNAAIEAAIYSIPGIAVSVSSGYDDLKNFEKAATFLGLFLDKLSGLKLSTKTVLNINYPAKAIPCLSCLKVTELGTRMYSDCYEKRTDPRGKTYFWLSGEPIEDGEAEESDVMATKNGFISLTPLHFDLTDYSLIDNLRNQLNQ